MTDLLNEVLKIDISYEAAKLLDVKVGVSQVGRYFFQPPTLTSDILAASQQKSMFSTSFKRSISYLFGD